MSTSNQWVSSPLVMMSNMFKAYTGSSGPASTVEPSPCGLSGELLSAGGWSPRSPGRLCWDCGHTVRKCVGVVILWKFHQVSEEAYVCPDRLHYSQS
eukprot:scaffold50473_cov59-Attheya_sp.AAC.7